MARALVTGVAGFIGSTLADRLLADGHEVVGVDSFEDYYPRAMKAANLARASESPRFTLVEGNLLDLGAPDEGCGCAPLLRRAIAESDYVYHLAAQAGVRASWGRSFRTYTESNVLATQLLLEECRHGGVKKVVYASSSSVYGDSRELPLREDSPCRPLSPYGVTKLAGEHLCGLYLSNFDSPDRHAAVLQCVRTAPTTRHGLPPVHPSTAQRRRDRRLRRWRADPRLHLRGRHRQRSDGSRRCTGRCDPESGRRVADYSLLDALRALEEATGLPVRPRLQAREAGDVRHTWADVTRARSVLGFEPKTNLVEGLRREFAWIRALPSEITQSPATAE